MQYLYVLVSTPNDNYYEQFLLSVSSLRLRMPDADVVLLCDTKTKEALTGKRAGYEKLVSKIITADTPEDMRQIEVSRWVKTSMRSLVPGDFLYIDCDTIITGDISKITELGIQFGACLDKHSLINKHSKSEKIIEMDKKLGFSSHVSNRHYNSGVIFCVDTPETHKVFARWHKLWFLSMKKNIVRDQHAFNMAIYENAPLFTELDGTWNCQIVFNGLPFLVDSKIIHYFATTLTKDGSPFLLASDSIYKKIKETGFIPDEVLELLKNPRTAFFSETNIIAGEDVLHVINSSFFDIYYWVYKNLPFLFNFINSICSFTIRIVKYFAIKTSRKKDGGIKHYN